MTLGFLDCFAALEMMRRFLDYCIALFLAMIGCYSRWIFSGKRHFLSRSGLLVSGYPSAMILKTSMPAGRLKCSFIAFIALSSSG